MSATYLLAHTSPAAPKPSITGEVTTASAKEQGHSDAIWCTKWCTLENGDGLVVTAGADHTIKTWNPVGGAVPIRTIRPVPCLGIVGLAVDPSGTGAAFFVANSLDSVVTRYSMDGELQGRKELGPSETWDLSLHPKSLHLATAGLDAKVRVLSSAPENFGEELTTMQASGTFGTTVEYSPDGRLLAVATDSGYVSLFDAGTGALISCFPGQYTSPMLDYLVLTSGARFLNPSAHSAPIRSISFTSSLLITASDDKRINVFDLRALTSGGSNQSGSSTRKGEVASMGGHEGWVVSVEARNDRLLASGSSDGTIKLWDLSAPTTALSTLRDHTGDVWSLSWAPDRGPPVIDGLGGASAGIGGGQLVTAGEDGALRWWRGGG